MTSASDRYVLPTEALEREGHLIAGRLVASSTGRRLEVTNPATERPLGFAPAGDASDAEAAVAAAAAAFPAWAATPKLERAAILRRFADVLESRAELMAQLLTAEVGAPLELSRRRQVGAPIAALRAHADMLEELELERVEDGSLVLREPAGVAVAIAPWNFPLLLGINKVAPALAAGCTVVLKPSEITPLHAFVLAEAGLEAGVPPGVLNVVTGTGPEVGEALVSDPRVDLVSLTGSTRAGRRVAELAAATVKRVHLELGGKSAAIVLEDADLERSVHATVDHCFVNSGQTCLAWTRLLVPAHLEATAVDHAVAAAESHRVGDPLDPQTDLGPLVSAAQRDRVTALVHAGLAEGAHLATGGTEPPEGLSEGFYVRPTVLAGVTNDLRVAREEIFGPVLSLLTYRDEGEAGAIANDSPYGLHGAVFAADDERALAVARRLRTGVVDLNGAPLNPAAPFGGYKQSGVGRELGRHGLDEYFELKAVQTRELA